MFGDALSTPAKTSDAAVTVFIGGVLTLLATVGLLGVAVAVVATPLALLVVPIALVPAFVLRGYYVAVLAAGAHREPGAPSIVRWGKLLSDGVKSVLVSAGYLLPAVLVVVLGVAALVALLPPEVADPATSPSALESSTSDARALGALAVLVLGSLLLLGYALLYAYVRPAALAVFAVSGSLREAFRLGRVRSVAGTGDYAVGWLLAGLLLVVGGLFVLPLSVLLVGFFLLFYLQVVAHSLYGRSAGEVLVPETESAQDEVVEGGTTADDPDGIGDVEEADAEDTDTDEADAENSAGGAGFPSEWAVESDGTDEVDDGSGTDDATDAEDATDSEFDAGDADDSLTDWDDVSAAVESSASAEADDSDGATPGAVTSAGGVSPAVQSGRGVALDESDYAERADSAPDEDVPSDDDTDTKPDDIDAEPDDTDTEPDDRFDWGPAGDR